ncbi:MAG: hypothetical protein R2939_01685 [Kofleriaceae bacterium]
MRSAVALALALAGGLAVTTAACAVDAGAALDGDAGPLDAAPLPPLAGATHDLTAADVTVLMPLPAPGVDALWPADLAARGGVLLPRAVVDELAAPSALAAAYDALRVIAVRFDPCFLSNWGTATCQPQVRLVLQPVDVAAGRAVDAAVHALYNLEPAELPALAQALRALTAAAPEQAASTRPLGVSPALAAQGVSGVYGQHLRALVTAVAGEANLARVTFVAPAAETSTGGWVFGGRAVRAFPGVGFGPPGPLVIRALGLDVTAQAVAPAPGAPFAYEVAPMIAAPDGAPAVSAPALAALSAGERAETYAWALRQESPRHVTADSTDCASCHLAGRARGFLEATYPDLVEPATIATRPPREPGAADQAGNLRALGYVDDAPAVSLRVAAETRDVLAAFADVR